MKYDRAIRWLHAGLAVAVAVQLFTSLFMQIPAPGHSPAEPGETLFRIHRLSGLCAVNLLLLHWLWQLTGHVANGWRHLYPWFSTVQMKKLKSDIVALPRWLRNGFPDQRVEPLPLAGAIHGLGLLAVSAMAVTGAIIFFTMTPGGGLPPAVLNLAQIHGFVANFVWIFVIGHVGMAIYHQVTGSPLISDMFNLIR